MDRVELRTFGCKVNTYDSGLLQKRLALADFAIADDARVHVLNTCAVTGEATKQALAEIRRIKRQDKAAVVVVTGCSAQVDTELFSEESGADLVVANSHKGHLPEILRQYLAGHHSERVFKSNIFKKADLEAGGGEELAHTRSFLKIQDGCDSFCTFCVIPFARGKSRSIEPEELIRRIHELEKSGVREVVITGVHIGDYRSQVGDDLTTLIGRLLAETDMPRLRLSSLEPVELSTGLMDAFVRSERLCRHFHMSIQSGSTRVLQLMKRQYGAEEVETSLNRLNELLPEAYVGMDIIAGFPGESETEFEETLALLRRTPWTRLHVFPYSERPHTYAVRLPDPVSPQDIKRRAAILREMSLERQQMASWRQIGSLKRVLILKGQRPGSHGLSRDYWSVVFDQPQTPGQEILVKIVGYDPGHNTNQEGYLRGEPC